MAIRRPNQIRNRGIRFAKGATGPYARKLGQRNQARACVRPNTFDCETGNIVPNGCFTNGTTVWTPEAATLAVIDVDNLEITKTGAVDAYARNTDIICETGFTYLIQARYQAVDASSVQMLLSGGLTRDDSGDVASAGGGFKTVEYQLTATQFTFTVEILVKGAGGSVGVVDYVKISVV